MKTLSLKLDDSTFEETEDILSQLNTKQGKYFAEAIKFYNRLNKRQLLAKQLELESKLTRDESLKILYEFEALHDDD